MLLMLIRTLLWGAAILVAALAFDYLRDSTGGVTIDLNGSAYGPFAPLEFVGLVVAVALLIWLAVKLFGLAIAVVRFLSGDETALSRYWNRSRERRGFDALSQGLIALAEGDGKTALTRARKAERLLARPGLTHLVIAQSAEASGDTALARSYYKELASQPETAFIGTKGLLSEALRKGETTRALKLAEHAFALKPKEGEVLTTLFGLQSQTEDWPGARKTLTASVTAKTLTKDVAARREAVLMLAEARETADETKKVTLTFGANKKSPGLIPAAADAAALHKAHDSERRARKVLQAAWHLNPHPDLAAAYAALAPDETPSERRKRFKDLTAIRPEHSETLMLRAELALADNDWDGAKSALGDITETAPTARSLSILAAIEKGRGSDEATVRGWLSKAVSSSRGPQWVCDNCGAVHGEWSPTCSACDAFDTVDWMERNESEDAMAAHAAMEPLMQSPDANAEIKVASETPSDAQDEKPQPATA